MKRAAIGLRMHSGWGAVVAVSNDGLLKVVDRKHIVVADSGFPGSKQPYHYAANLDLKQAEAYIARCSGASGQLACSAICEIQSGLEKNGYRVEGSALLMGAGRQLPSLENILASHALIGLARICEKRGQHARARKLYEKSIAAFLPTATDRAARLSLARLARREGDFELVYELWKDAVGNSRHGYEAYEQLAIYYEHKARDPGQAQQIVRQALNELRRAFQVGDVTPGAYREFKADLIDEWSGSNGRVGSRSWMSRPCKLRLNGE